MTLENALEKLAQLEERLNVLEKHFEETSIKVVGGVPFHTHRFLNTVNGEERETSGPF